MAKLSENPSSLDDQETGFVEDMQKTKQQISGGGKKKRARASKSPATSKKARRGKSKSPAKKKGGKSKSKSPAKKKGRKSKSKSPAKKKGRKSKSKSKSPGKAKRKSKSKSPSAIPMYPPDHLTRPTKYRYVYEGKAQKTGKGGLTKSQLTLNKVGKVVSKKMSQRGKANASHTNIWRKALEQANDEFQADNPSHVRNHFPKKGTALYNRTIQIKNSSF